MEIVPTTTSTKKEAGLEILLNRKALLKQQLEDQKTLITVRTQQLFTPLSFPNYLLRSFSKGLNIVDAALMGYKIIKSIRMIIYKFRK